MSNSENTEAGLAAAHEYFAAHCFNQAWTFMDKEERTLEDEEEMIRLAIASHWHWTQRADYGPAQATIAYWQVSRVFALLEQPDNATRFARRCIEVIEGTDVDPFFRGYALEAMARASAVAGDAAAMKKHLDAAREVAAKIENEDNRKILTTDLDTIQIRS